jgi:hypothetical protein
LQCPLCPKKIPENKLTKGNESPLHENYKSLKKEIKDDYRSWKMSHGLRLEEPIM